jgi:malic enzyme
MEKNMRMWIWIIVAIVAVVAVVWFFTYNNTQKVIPPTTGNNSITTEQPSVQDISSTDVGAGAVTIAYADALVKYADRRIQLDSSCQAHPNNVTYKDNTGIMIDNRSAKTRTVKVGTTFTIKPWGFKIVVLPDIYLKTKTLLVDCDQSQNVATILIQE